MKNLLARSAFALLLAAGTASGADSAFDSQGKAVRGTGGACVGATTSGAKDPACAKEAPRQTFRILQGMIPQPFATYSLPPPMAAAEVVLIPLKQPWESGSAMLSPTQREELYQVMAQLEVYRLIDAFEVITYPGQAKDAAFNQKLAQKRAQSLSSFLASVGIPPGQITSRIADASGSGRTELNVTVRGRR